LRRRSAGAVLLVSLAVGACAPRPHLRVGEGRRTDPAPWVEALRRYNREPRQARLAGVFRIPRRGSARFGALVDGETGFRVDATGGAGGLLLFSLSCTAQRGCLAYVPGRGRAYRVAPSPWQRWLGMLLLGRAPRLGPPRRAWILEDGGCVLEFVGGDWVQRIWVSGTPARPVRMEVLRAGIRRMAVTWKGTLPDTEVPFPEELRVLDLDRGHELRIEFRRVTVLAAPVDPEDVDLRLPAVVPVEETDPWNPKVFPLWLPVPNPPGIPTIPSG